LGRATPGLSSSEALNRLPGAWWPARWPSAVAFPRWHSAVALWTTTPSWPLSSPGTR